MTAARHYRLEGRLRAVFFRLSTCSMVLVTAGCAMGKNPSIDGLFGVTSDSDISQQAEATPYASLDMTVNGNGGLIILAEQAGDMTYWQFADDSTIALQDGYLKSTSGLESNLIDTRVLSSDLADKSRYPWRMSTDSAHYRVEREWQAPDGYVRHGQADASLNCDSSVSAMELPLTTRQLQPCHETLAWDGGEVTSSTLWRSPDDGRLWVVETQPWPNAPTFEWRIARPWQTVPESR